MARFYDPTSLDPKSVKFNDDLATLLGLRLIHSRQLFLYGAIEDIETYTETCPDLSRLTATEITRIILELNLDDDLAQPAPRRPILLFINSPGGDSGEGFALADAIEASKTPVWTINLGQWSSMGFLIGIAGRRRLSLARSTFLWHDGSTGYFGSSGKVQDTADFNKRYENEVVKQHVLKHSNPETFTEAFYDAHVREEFYMLPEDALKFGFIDGIVTDLSAIFREAGYLPAAPVTSEDTPFS